jgi:hypothetical protein
MNETGQILPDNTYIGNSLTPLCIANGPEGIAYIPAGSLAFPNLSMAVFAYGDGTVVVFEVGNDGLPKPKLREKW